MLGPLEIRADDSTAIEVSGARLRTLLIALALEPGRIVSTSRLVDAIWGEDPPEKSVNAIQALVSRLRRILPDAPVESHATGYGLMIEPEAVDATRFERLMGEGRSALSDDPEAAARTLREALDLWRGTALLDVADAEYFESPVVRLSEQRLAAIEDRVEADLRLGRGQQLTTELTTLVADHPLRERLVASFMRALCAAGRPAEALEAYERARQALADALGADPSPELSGLHTAVLRGELAQVPSPSATPAESGPDAPGTAGTEPAGTEPAGAELAEAEPDRPTTNLRAGLTSFIGRDEDVTRIPKLVQDNRLTTLTGPGGAGKTRLSVEVARRLTDQMPDGAWLVELSPISDGADVPQAILTALGLREQAIAGWAPADEPLDRLVTALRARHTLLVLDNCEHLINAVAVLSDRLLGECPQLKILATSREPLAITGEAVWPVKPLALPTEDVSATEAAASPAVQLLADRAGAARPGFELTETTAPTLARICRALDGMPLAIELAAARLRTMTVEQLATRLDDRFRLLSGGSRVAMRQHQTLRAVVDWSWDLLSDEERVLLRRLAIFVGGATIESAEWVCAGDVVDADRVFELLTALTDKSLLVAGDDGGPRYRMLETIKAYCLERLDEAGERERIRRAHADHFIEFAETVDPHLRRAEQLEWRSRIAAEHDNLTSALRGAIAAGDAPRAVRMVAAAGWYWWLSGRKAEGLELTEAALEVPGEVDDASLASALAIAVLFATAGLGDERNARKWLDNVARLDIGTESLSPLVRFINPANEIMRAALDGSAPRIDAMDELLTDDDPWVSGMGRLNRARMLYNAGSNVTEATTDAEAALVAFRDIGERWGLSFALQALADIVAQRGDLAAALAYYEEAIVVVTEMGTIEDVLFMRGKQIQLRWLLGDSEGSAAAEAEADREARQTAWPDALAGLAHARADLARWKGELDTARTYLAEAETVLRHMNIHPVFRAMELDSMAHVDALAGDLETANARRSEALTFAVRSAHAPTAGQVLVGIADQAMRKGKPSEAATMLAAGDAIRGAPDLFSPDATRVEAEARAVLGDDGFVAAARLGEGVTLETARDAASPILDV